MGRGLATRAVPVSAARPDAPPPARPQVHHGNGTEACVANTAPRTLRFPWSTPLSEGVSVHHTWAPWLGEDDDDNIFFASVQARPGAGAR